MSAIHSKVITTAKDITSHRVRHKFEGKILIVVLVASLTFAAMPSISFAGNVEGNFTKTLTWQFGAADINSAQGSYRLRALAEAWCRHGSDVNSPTDKTGSWFLKNGVEANLSAETRRWKVPDAYAKGQAAISATKPKEIAKKRYELMVYESKTCMGEASYCDKDDHKSEGKPGESGVYPNFGKGVKEVGWVLRGAVNGVELEKQSSKNKATGRIEGPDWAEIKCTDPISISLTEIDTNIVTTEELFNLDIEGTTKYSEIGFDYDLEMGLSLWASKNNEGVVDGSVAISGAATSDWLVNPFGEFGVSLDGGAFAATGVWDGLPWVITYDDLAVVEAFLPADYLPANFDYVVPDSLINDSYEYEQVLSMDSMLSVGTGVAGVPEPMTLSLLGFGSLALLRRRRV